MTTDKPTNIVLSLLKQARETDGITQEHLAELAGVSCRTIQRIESGHETSLDTAKGIAAALGLSSYTMLMPVREGGETPQEDEAGNLFNDTRARLELYFKWKHIHFVTVVIIVATFIVTLIPITQDGSDRIQKKYGALAINFEYHMDNMVAPGEKRTLADFKYGRDGDNINAEVSHLAIMDMKAINAFHDKHCPDAASRLSNDDTLRDVLIKSDIFTDVCLQKKP